MSVVLLLIYILVIGLIIGLIYYVVDALPVPEPLNRVIKIVSVVIGILAIIILLLNFVGAGPNLRITKAESDLQRAARATQEVMNRRALALVHLEPVNR